jgi:hypothetical protein
MTRTETDLEDTAARMRRYREALERTCEWMERVGYDSPAELEPGMVYRANREALDP